MSTEVPSRPIPQPPPTFDAQAWREKLAGLTDPDYSGEDNAVGQEFKTTAIDLCVCLCELFGDSLDRITLWDRIATALATACAKCDDGDIDRFVSLCLEHVRADPSRAARHDFLTGMLMSSQEQPVSWRQGFVRWVASHSYALIAHARVRWEKIKAMKMEDR